MLKLAVYKSLDRSIVEFIRIEKRIERCTIMQIIGVKQLLILCVNMENFHNQCNLLALQIFNIYSVEK